MDLPSNSGGQSPEMEPVTEETANHPPILDPLSGSRDSYDPILYARATAKLQAPPKAIRGELDEDPRYMENIPREPEAMLDLMTGRGGGSETEAEAIRAEELSMQLQRVNSLRSEALPPIPLTPQELKALLEEKIPAPDSAYTVWIPVESSTIDKTVVGEYGQQVHGSILRFIIEHNDYFTPFNLIPDLSEEGFGWYQNRTSAGNMWDGLLDAEEAQRLNHIIDSDGNARILSSTPDRLKNAASLLNERLSPDNPSPTPEGWLTTMCERDMEKSEIFSPRYTATFIHTESEVVIEIAAEEQAGNVLEDANVEEDREDRSIAIKSTDIDEDYEKVYSWEIHFAPDSIVDAATEQFDSTIHPMALADMFKMVSEKVE